MYLPYLKEIKVNKVTILGFFVLFLVIFASLFYFFPGYFYHPKDQTQNSTNSQPEKWVPYSSKYLSLTYPDSFEDKEVQSSLNAALEQTNFIQKKCDDLKDFAAEKCRRQTQVNILIQDQLTDLENYNRNYYDGWEGGITLFGDCIVVKGSQQKTSFLGFEAIENNFSLPATLIKTSTCTNQENWDTNKNYTQKSWVFAQNKRTYTVRIVGEDESLLAKANKMVASIKLK